MRRATVRRGWTILACAVGAAFGTASASALQVAEKSARHHMPTYVASEGDFATYGQTQYPIVLVHGVFGFAKMAGVLDYWYGIGSELKVAGAQVYVVALSPFNSSEARGEDLLAQVQEILAVSGAAKVNLIGHSQGGIDARYVLAVRPDLLASVTTMGSPHQGSDVADFLRAHISNGGWENGALQLLGDFASTLLNLLTGEDTPANATALLDGMTQKGMATFNGRYPAGLPASPCGDGAWSANGVQLFSWGGSNVLTNVFDILDPVFGAGSLVFASASDDDGIVARCSNHFGQVLRDNYGMNHGDEVNQLAGLVSPFSTRPKTVYRDHANRLKLAGL